LAAWTPVCQRIEFLPASATSFGVSTSILNGTCSFSQRRTTLADVSVRSPISKLIRSWKSAGADLTTTRRASCSCL